MFYVVRLRTGEYNYFRLITFCQTWRQVMEYMESCEKAAEKGNFAEVRYHIF